MVPLKENKTQNIIIDLKDTRIQWTEELYKVYTYYNEDVLIHTLEFNKQGNDIDLLKITSNNLGIIAKDEVVSFDVNISDAILSLQYYKDNEYQDIQIEEYLDITVSDDKLSYEIKTLETIPAGTYRIKLTQKYEDNIICEKYLSFFVMETAIEEVVA